MGNFGQRFVRAVKVGFRAMQSHGNAQKEEWQDPTLDAWLPPSDQLPEKLLAARNRAIMATFCSFERRLGTGNWQLKSALLAFGICAILAYGKVLNIGASEWHGVLLWLGFGIVAGLVRETVRFQISSILCFEQAVAISAYERKVALGLPDDSAIGFSRTEEAILRRAVAEALDCYRNKSKFAMFWPGSAELDFHQNAKSLASLFSQEIWFRLASTLCLFGAVVCLALELPIKW